MIGICQVKTFETDSYLVLKGVNHLGHFLLTKLLLPALVKTG